MKSHLPIPEAIDYSGLTRTHIYGALKRRELKARKAGRRTIIAVSDLDAYLTSLPKYAAGA